METAENIKQTVRAKYAEIAQQDRADNAASCCGSGGCSTLGLTLWPSQFP
ncbi:MAG TPA: hypothetical protein PLV70_05040, partial [Flavobacteriales bacterium]|nr:hypothetical protein [Flavobacteriales bacterium]